MAIAGYTSAAADTLLERDDALAALRGAHSETKAGSGRLVLVSGEAGVGKTSLVFLRKLGARTRLEAAAKAVRLGLVERS